MKKQETVNPLEKTYLVQLFDSLEFDCWAMDESRQYIFQNYQSRKNWQRVEGLTLDELNIPPDLKRKWSDQLDEVFNGKRISSQYYSESVQRHFKSIISPIIKDGRTVGVVGATFDITDIKENEIALIEKNQQWMNLNTTLNVLLDKRANDQKEIEDETTLRIYGQISPLIERIKSLADNPLILQYANKIEDSILKGSSGSAKFYNHLLSPMEGVVVDAIKSGLSSKEIAHELNISKSTVDSHRNSIRKKLGIKNSGQNLKSFLMGNS